MSDFRHDDTTLDRAQARTDHARASQSPEQRAQREMEERNRAAWKTPEGTSGRREDATDESLSDAERARRDHSRASESPEPRAKREMEERNRNLWKGSK